MSIIGGCAVAVSTLTALYLGRKGWRAFHKAVGIEPKVMIYEPAARGYVNAPRLVALNVDKTALQSLPIDAITLIKKLDDKAKSYQQWQQTLQSNSLPDHSKDKAQAKTLKALEKALDREQNKNQGNKAQETALSEAHFVLVKLLNERLPEIVNIYASFAINKPTVQSLPQHSSDTLSKNTAYQGMSKNQQQAYQTLMLLLTDIDQRLDMLLVECEQQQLQQLEVMARYLNKR